MRRELETFRRILGACFVWGLLFSWVPGSACGQSPPKDVGLVTGLWGEVIYSSQAQSQGPSRVETFMKVRVGDLFRLEPGASIQIVYFQGNRQEVWKGPACFRVGETQGEPEGDSPARPEVSLLPTGAGQGIQRIPVLLRRAGLSRGGGMQVRGAPSTKGGKEAGAAGPALTPQEQAEIQSAWEAYREMRQRAAAGDVTPELFMLGVLSDYEQYGEMEALLQEALSRHPGDVVLRDLARWVREHRGRSR